MSHTPTPWRVCNYDVIVPEDSDQNEQAAIAGTYGLNCHENAKRIVACVNACEGLSNKDLKDRADSGGIKEYYERLIATVHEEKNCVVEMFNEQDPSAPKQVKVIITKDSIKKAMKASDLLSQIDEPASGSHVQLRNSVECKFPVGNNSFFTTMGDLKIHRGGLVSVKVEPLHEEGVYFGDIGVLLESAGSIYQADKNIRT